MYSTIISCGTHYKQNQTVSTLTESVDIATATVITIRDTHPSIEEEGIFQVKLNTSASIEALEESI